MWWGDTAYMSAFIQCGAFKNNNKKTPLKLPCVCCTDFHFTLLAWPFTNDLPLMNLLKPTTFWSHGNSHKALTSSSCSVVSSGTVQKLWQQSICGGPLVLSEETDRERAKPGRTATCMEKLSAHCGAVWVAWVGPRQSCGQESRESHAAPTSGKRAFPGW